MTTEPFDPHMNCEDPNPRLPCVLLLDTSASMMGQPIAELNKGLKTFSRHILEDTLARSRVELMVISFGGSVASDARFVEAQDFQPRTLVASGNTPIGAALLAALQALDKQKAVYRQAGTEYFRPWLIVMTDGAPTDDHGVLSQALGALSEAQKRNAVTVFPIGIGDGADLAFLDTLSSERIAVKLEEFNAITHVFTWLSSSMASVSANANATIIGGGGPRMEDAVAGGSLTARGDWNKVWATGVSAEEIRARAGTT